MSIETRSAPLALLIEYSEITGVFKRRLCRADLEKNGDADSTQPPAVTKKPYPAMRKR
jgi:hypothetical protein